jgi:hypothetical protein
MHRISQPDNQVDPRLDLQIELEKLYSKNQTLTRIRTEFIDCPEFDFIGYLNEKNIDPEFGLDLLVQMVLHKRTTLSILTAILRPHFNDSQKTVDEIKRAAEADLVDWHASLGLFIVRFDISADVQAELEQYQYPLPMVVQPRLVRTNRDTGYCETQGSIILKKNHHGDDVCLDHINRMNSIRFAIDIDTVRMIRNRWRNLDHPKTGESDEEFRKRVKAFEKYDRSSRAVISKLLQFGNYFWLTHKYDKRGRTYCQGYHVNYQGAPWNKAVIELADKELVE